MSSTNPQKRGGGGKDIFPTPAWCVRRFIESVWLPVGGTWLEPGAGNGAIIRAVGHRNWTAVEIRPECGPDLRRLTSDVHIINFLDFRLRAEVVIGNPPFSAAFEFVQHALPLAPWVALLLRLNFFGSAKRSSFFQREMPDVYVLPNRPSFTGNGRGDSIEYGWFVWGPVRGRRKGKIELLADTPLEERTLRRRLRKDDAEQSAMVLNDR